MMFSVILTVLFMKFAFRPIHQGCKSNTNSG